MMGFFATYMGFIYNDCMSKSLSILGKSCYYYDSNIDKDKYILNNKDCIYIFGFDPVWMNTTNDINFANSFKMKASVIIGVA
jgi:V-type H+-transporting ATPase subunit a